MISLQLAVIATLEDPTVARPTRSKRFCFSFLSFCSKVLVQVGPSQSCEAPVAACVWRGGVRHSAGTFWRGSCDKPSAIKAALREATAQQPVNVLVVSPQLCSGCTVLVRICDCSGAVTDVTMCCQRRNDEMKGKCLQSGFYA